ncbi:MAG: OPT/YSL family transporter [Labilithrix sp.]|nr:OPT/YSL family transporter [Labilithrix sp.]MBX3221288.1 OPT/YSL family transporter [Labilithrix sp.]
MSLFQRPAETPEEKDASRPLEIAPERVLEMDEPEWYARVYRPGAAQLTVRAIVLGSVLGFFLSFTNIYIGLKTGWFLGVNLTAAILSYAVWTGLTNLAREAPRWPLWKKVLLPGPWLLGVALHKLGIPRSGLSILENTTTVSTASSAGYATGFMLISAIPAMLLLTVTEANPKGTQLPPGVVAAWVFFLALLGVTLAIPMKRGMINREKLKFPSGTAAAVTLQGLYSRGEEALAKARALFATAAVSGIVPLLKDLEILKVRDPKTGEVLREGGAIVRDTVLPGQSNVFDWIATALPALWSRLANAGPARLHPEGKTFLPSDYHIKLDHGVALAFAGILIGVRITAWMVVGGLVVAFFLAPPALGWEWENAAGKLVGAATRPQTAWKEIGIWTGAPLLVSSGLVAFAAQWRTIGRAIAGMLPGKAAERGADGSSAGDALSSDVEVPTSWFLAGLAVSATGIITVAHLYFEIPVHYGILAVAMTFVLAIVACRATGESDITPGGPLGKIMQLTYGVLIPQSSTANLQTAGITAGSSHASADLLNDLKTGYLLGANPRRQFIAQALGIFTGTVASSLGYLLLVPNALPLTGTESRPAVFPAVAAQQWKAVAEVFKFGLANLHPMSQSAIWWGAGIGVVLALVEIFAPKGLKRFLPSPTGLGLGMVLPFFYPLAMFLGALFGAIATAWKKDWADKYLVAIAAGGIAGESIVGVIVQALNNFVLH